MWLLESPDRPEKFSDRETAHVARGGPDQPPAPRAREMRIRSLYVHAFFIIDQRHPLPTPTSLPPLVERMEAAGAALAEQLKPRGSFGYRLEIISPRYEYHIVSRRGKRMTAGTFRMDTSALG